LGAPDTASHQRALASNLDDATVGGGDHQGGALRRGLASPAGNPLADALLMGALRLLARHLPGEALGPEAAARAGLALAALMGGQGTLAGGGGLATAMGRLIGARHHVENGIVNAIMLPHAMRFSAEVTRPGIEKIAVALGRAPSREAPVEAVIAALARVLAPLGLPRRLRETGIPRAALAEVAALGMADWFLRGNPRPFRNAAELAALLDQAW
jgi:alcohol dehydrogenase class IV